MIFLKSKHIVALLTDMFVFGGVIVLSLKENFSSSPKDPYWLRTAGGSFFWKYQGVFARW